MPYDVPRFPFQKHSFFIRITFYICSPLFEGNHLAVVKQYVHSINRHFQNVPHLSAPIQLARSYVKREQKQLDKLEWRKMPW